MPARLAQVLETVRHSLWFVPAVAVVLAAIVAGVAVWASHLVPWGTEPGAPTLLFGGGAEAARATLQAIATAVITVAGVTFSITVVALQLASTQYSPRVLRNFLRDLGNQVSLGVFIATFTYALLVLQTIQAGGDNEAPFVPAVAMTVAIGLGLVSMGTLVYFIHHIATQVQISSIVEETAEETARLIRDTWPEDGHERDPDTDRTGFSGRSAPLSARRSGFVEYVAVEPLVDFAAEHDLRIRVDAPPGSWVDEGNAILTVFGTAPENLDKAVSQVQIGSERTMQQDVTFGVRQLADIAVKALSPGMNDPTTATYCIERIGTVLIEAGRRTDPQHEYRDDDGDVRVLMDMDGFAELAAVAFDQIRHYGGHDAYVMSAVAGALARVEKRVPAERHPPLRRHARALVDAMGDMEPKDKAAEIPSVLSALVGGQASGGR